MVGQNAPCKSSEMSVAVGSKQVEKLIPANSSRWTICLLQNKENVYNKNGTCQQKNDGSQEPLHSGQKWIKGVECKKRGIIY